MSKGRKKTYRGSWLLASARQRMGAVLPVVLLMWVLTYWALG